MILYCSPSLNVESDISALQITCMPLEPLEVLPLAHLQCAGRGSAKPDPDPVSWRLALAAAPRRPHLAFPPLPLLLPHTTITTVTTTGQP